IAVMANLNVTAFPEAVRAFYLNAMLGLSPDADVKSIAASNAALAKHFDQAPAKKPKGGKFATPLQKLVGVYENDLYGQFTIVKASDGLAVECGPAKYRGTLTHWQNGVFHLKFPGATNLPDDITFTIGADGTPDSFTDDVLGLFTRVRQ